MFCLPLTCLGFGGLYWSTFILPIDVAGQDYSVEAEAASVRSLLCYILLQRYTHRQ